MAAHQGSSMWLSASCDPQFVNFMGCLQPRGLAIFTCTELRSASALNLWEVMWGWMGTLTMSFVDQSPYIGCAFRMLVTFLFYFSKFQNGISVIRAMKGRHKQKKRAHWQKPIAQLTRMNTQIWVVQHSFSPLLILASQQPCLLRWNREHPKQMSRSPERQAVSP